MRALTRPATTEVHVVLHVPSAAPLVDLTAEISDMARRLNGHWEYRPAPRQPSAFHIHAEKMEGTLL